MSRNISPFGVRMPPELKVKIEESAKDNGRSINAEVVHRLEESYTDLKLSREPTKEKTLDEILEAVKEIQESTGLLKYFKSDEYRAIKGAERMIEKITKK